MQELHDLRPAPRRTPTAVLWLMAAVVVGASGLLILALPTPQVGAQASATRDQSSPATTHASRPPASAAAAEAPMAIGSLQVP